MKFDSSFGIGSRSGKLVILKIAYRKDTPDGSRIYYKCKCDCGNKKVYERGILKRGGAISCGCMRGLGQLKHGATRGKGDSLYHVWASMKGRCKLKSFTGYENYGGRGISVCEEWKDDYIAFRDWALANGYKKGLAIDRINNDGNYEPSNCRWVTQAENNRNNRRNKWITAFGEKKLLWDWFKDKRCLVKFNTVYQRLRKGYGYKQALFTPPTPIPMRRKEMRGIKVNAF